MIKVGKFIKKILIVVKKAYLGLYALKSLVFCLKVACFLG